MERSSKPHVMCSCISAMFFTVSIYTYLAFISAAYFGAENVNPSIFNNIKKEEGKSPLILLCLFLVIFCCNIPFVFFVGKTAFMAVIHQCCYSKRTEESENEDKINSNIAVLDDINKNELYEQMLDNINYDNKMLDENNNDQQTNQSTAGSYVSYSADENENSPDDQLPYFVYVCTCLLYLTLIALAAIFINDLTLVFGIVAGFAECSTVFILPSVFYLIACARE